jgi:hypothetical protein
MLALPDHHSPSSINLWRNAPKKWCLSYLFGWRDSGPQMWRGSAVEHGFAAHLRGAEPVGALAVAYEKYLNESADKTPDEGEFLEQRNLIYPMLQQAIAWHKANPVELAAFQIKIDVYLDDVERPFTGWVDFGLLNGTDMDLKSTEACPSSPRPDHIGQLAVYWKKRDRPQNLLYVTAKKHAHFELSKEALEGALQDIIDGAKSLEQALRVMPDRDTMLRSYPANSSFYYDEATREKLKQLGA